MDRKFVEYKKVGPKWPPKAQGQIDNMPLRDWERIQRVADKRERFEFIREIDLEARAGRAEQVKDVPIEEDPLECPICGLVAQSEGKLAQHKIKIHDI